MPCNFKPGDVVQLKSGGPNMTVISIEGDKARTEWLNPKTHKREEDIWACTSLREPKSGIYVGSF